MTEPSYDPRQAKPLTDAQRQEFYDWCATEYGYQADHRCRYCSTAPCVDPWGHAQRETMWEIYVALRDSANPWADMPMPTKTYLDGLYGRDYE